MKKRFLFFLPFFIGYIFYGNAQVTIQMEKSGGVYKIPCKVNGLGLKFIFDTGASDVSLSLTEALFMLKNGYLSDKDFMGTEYYKIANGEIQEGTKVNLKSIEVGGQKIYNVQASITHTLDAPLLFGQSAMERFGKFAIDYSNSSLILGGGTSKTQVVAEIPDNEDVPSCIDVDGNTYATVKIGKQIWMAEFLRVIHYNNGDLINEKPQVFTPADSNFEMRKLLGLVSWFGPAENKRYQYDWYVISDKRKICPIGWHIPATKEISELAAHYGFLKNTTYPDILLYEKIGDVDKLEKIFGSWYTYWVVPNMSFSYKHQGTDKAASLVISEARGYHESCICVKDFKK